MIGVEGTAKFDPTGQYRYELHRKWHGGNGLVTFVMLNPSTADSDRNDPTVARCLRYAREWGFGRMIVVNIFAFRSTCPERLKLHPAPVGPRNNRAIAAAARQSDLVIGAWGNHGLHLNREAQVLKLLHPVCALHCLGVTAQGSPKHPLYLRATLRPILLNEAVAAL